MGSEKYPYKGVLDTLANRSFANGTNAWTDTTNTTYTIGTAGAEGFLAILPVFLDHVLYPTITSAGFVSCIYFSSVFVIGADLSERTRSRKFIM